jgi:hypothetical protein
MQTVKALTGQAAGPAGEVERSLFDAQAQMFGMLSMWAYASERGVGVRFASETP